MAPRRPSWCRSSPSCPARGCSRSRSAGSIWRSSGPLMISSVLSSALSYINYCNRAGAENSPAWRPARWACLRPRWSGCRSRQSSAPRASGCSPSCPGSSTYRWPGPARSPATRSHTSGTSGSHISSNRADRSICPRLWSHGSGPSAGGGSGSEKTVNRCQFVCLFCLFLSPCLRFVSPLCRQQPTSSTLSLSAEGQVRSSLYC